MYMKVYSGLEKTKEPAIEVKVSRYSVTDSQLSATIEGGMLPKVPYNGELCSVVLYDTVNGQIEKVCKYVSYSFMVFDNPATGETNIIGDNTLLFSVLY